MQKIKLKIEDLGYNGEGIAHNGGKTFFVPFALPSEEVEAEIETEKGNVVFAKLTKILTRSEQRVSPPCPYYMECGGCDIQHMKYSEQLLFKQNLVKNTIKKIAGVEATVLPCEKSEKQFEYRNKIALPVRDGKLGLTKKGSHEIVEIEKCKITEQFNAKLIKILKTFLCKFENKNISHFVSRFLNANLLLTIVSKNENVLGIDYLKNEIAKQFKTFSINININKKSDAEILTDNFKNVCGSQTIEDEFGGVKYFLSSGSFFQVNNNVREKIYEYVQALVSGKNIIDAYSGAGLLTCMMGESAEKVFAVEIVKVACENAKQTAKQNELNNVEIVCGDCKIEIPKICEKNKVDFAILDPPRAGCDKNVLTAIMESKIPNLIYISCSPQTLARDIKVLKDSYEIASIKPFDMFPQTHHVESVVVLNLKK